jgi:hypothetical protein
LKRVIDRPFSMKYAGEVSRPCGMSTADGRWITSD